MEIYDRLYDSILNYKSKYKKFLVKHAEDILSDKDTFMLYLDYVIQQYDAVPLSYNTIEDAIIIKILLFLGYKDQLLEKFPNCYIIEFLDLIIIDDWDDIFPVGKYNGWTIEEIVEDDPNYFWKYLMEWDNIRIDAEFADNLAEHTCWLHKGYDIKDKGLFAYRFFHDYWPRLEWEYKTKNYC